MIYEIRMTVTFTYGGKPKEARVFVVESEPERRIKTTLIGYISANSDAEAFTKAAERKHEITVDLAKGEAELLDRKAWGPRSNNISISLDAVVAKPELNTKMPENTKCYNTKCWNQDKIKNECSQYYYNIDKCAGWKEKP